MSQLRTHPASAAPSGEGDKMINAIQPPLFTEEAPPLPSEDEAIAIIERAGWRLVRRGREWECWRNDEVTTVERGNLPYWAEQIKAGLG